MDADADAPTVFDDTNPHIAYTPADLWIRGGAQGEHNFTTHGTLTANAEARLAFTGTSIAVYGTLIYTTRELVSTYTLDSAPRPVTFTAPHWSPNTNSTTPTDTSARPQHLLYRSPPLPNGPHTLLITTITADSGFWLDCFAITGPAPALTPWDPSFVPANTTTTRAGPDATTTPTRSASTRARTGAIAGGVVGGLAALTLVAVVLWCWRSRSRRRLHIQGQNQNTEAQGTRAEAGRYTVRGGTVWEKRGARAHEGAGAGTGTGVGVDAVVGVGVSVDAGMGMGEESAYRGDGSPPAYDAAAGRRGGT